MLHGRILTGDNLQKSGIEGPFRCPLYRVNFESIAHFFFFFDFTREVWDLLTISWFGKVEFFGNVQLWLVNWEKVYTGDVVNKKGMKQCWLMLPKLVC